VRAGYNSHEVSPAAGGGFGRPVRTDEIPTGGSAKDEVPTGGTGRQALKVRGILNLGVRPDVAIRAARKVLEQHGGVVLEGCGVSGVAVSAQHHQHNPQRQPHPQLTFGQK
jgi:hypothetical protein